MHFDTKIVMVLRDDLAGWQKLNVTAYLASGIAHAHADVVGRPYADGSGNAYLAMFGQPVLVFAGDAPALTRTHERALAAGLSVAVFTEELFQTGSDDDNRAAVAAVPADKLALVGLGIYGRRNAVDKAVKGLSLHR
jgi:hypothetical protein